MSNLLDNSVGASYEGTRVLEDHSDNRSPTYHWIYFIDHLFIWCLKTACLLWFCVRRRNWEASSWCTQLSRQSTRALPAQSALNPAQPKQPRRNRQKWNGFWKVLWIFLIPLDDAISLIFSSIVFEEYINFCPFSQLKLMKS